MAKVNSCFQSHKKVNQFFFLQCHCSFVSKNVVFYDSYSLSSFFSLHARQKIIFNLKGRFVLITEMSERPPMSRERQKFSDNELQISWQCFPIDVEFRSSFHPKRSALICNSISKELFSKRFFRPFDSIIIKTRSTLSDEIDGDLFDSDVDIERSKNISKRSQRATTHEHPTNENNYSIRAVADSFYKRTMR